jgi:threonyl-tRNA synthetase
MERFISILIEHTTGKLPLWLAPDHLLCCRLAKVMLNIAGMPLIQLEKEGLSGYVDDRNETIGRKIRDTELKKVPYMLIAGDKEMAEGTVAVRKQGQGDQGAISLIEFAAQIADEIG